ncbi:hsp70 family protein [bacterium]|jgi:molecular chaperone DnaK (HSP70)|nr:hsp70 family protein [Verrucomicrobiota bacterium]MDA7667623.1 hsp70 family protein [bacterium]
MKYSIGIDLGTTNCALASVLLADPNSKSQPFSIPQWNAPGVVGDAETLPSFLFRPMPSEADSFGKESWIVGDYARKMAGDRPDAVAHSAKSWLCHHTVDRTRPILPWNPGEAQESEKISPVAAATCLLKHVRKSWDGSNGISDSDAVFRKQRITITVPASFDSVAQKLTLQAAFDAGYPDDIRLLEEPQAAFYRWLEQHPESDALTERLPALVENGQHVLVVDVGGGTSDFSLFKIELIGPERKLVIKREAVSDHILLGGDNIDLALAHLVEPRLNPSESSSALSSKQWSYLVSFCRDLKERVLSNEESDFGADSYNVSVPAKGSGLMAGTLTTSIDAKDVHDLLFRGFFQRCRAVEKPDQHHSALREMGLPYAKDSAILRHLAAFLNKRPTVDAVLFNGGTMKSSQICDRVVEQIAEWQEGKMPVVLENLETDLSVARGAAYYGAGGQSRPGTRIEAGAARAVYLEVEGESSGDRSEKPLPRTLLCLLPRGTASETNVIVSKPELHLRLNTRVSFQTWQSTRHESDLPGALVPFDGEEFQPLPPLLTIAEIPPSIEGRTVDQVPVELKSQLNALGLVEVECVSKAPDLAYSWPLEFDLRGDRSDLAGGTTSNEGASPNLNFGVPEDRFVRAAKRLVSLFKKTSKVRDQVTPTQGFKSLEKALEIPKQQWNGALVRGLWASLEATYDTRSKSVEHEETWISMAGFLLRPGYGAPLDEHRIQSLWRLGEEGTAFPNKRIKIQTYVLWRRVAGGLSRARQCEIIEPELSRLKVAKSPPSDLIQLVGSLERLPLELKQELASSFIERSAELIRGGGHASPYLIALNGLLSRIPLYAGPECVLPAEIVEQAFRAFEKIEWSGAQYVIELRSLFLRAARLTGNRHLDVSRSIARKIAAKLVSAGATNQKVAPLVDVIPLSVNDRTQQFGESLPAGLVLGEY